MSADVREGLESRIDQWRAYIIGQGATDDASLEETESQLRYQAGKLAAAGLDADEAFLVAIKRVSATDAASREFARTYSDNLWAQPTLVQGERGSARQARAELWIMLGLAVAAAVAIKIPTLFGYELSGDGADFYARNLSLFVLPFLAAYFAWKRRLRTVDAVVLAAVFVTGFIVVNVYPFKLGGSTEVLAAIHLPIVLWLAVGVAYTAGDWRSDSKRMEYVRFTGEWFVNYALIALGGGVLTAITIGVFGAIGLNAEPFMQEWVIPCGAMGAVLVAAWLVENRRNLSGGMAPMLARVFTPLFTLVLVALLAGVVWTRGFVDVEREVLILFDVLLVVVLALLLYAISARDPRHEPDFFDRIQLLLVACALAVDVFALVSIAGRLSEFGFSANKTAALGLNVILLVNLAWSAVLQTGFIRSRHDFAAVEHWQMRYLPVYAIWAAIVVLVFPPLFGFA